MKKSVTHLKRALLANAIFSGISGITLLATAPQLSEMMNIANPWVLRIVGACLLFFVLQLAGAVRKPDPKMVRVIIIQDWLWVMGTVIIISAGLFGLSAQGYWLMIAVAAVVAVLALAQGYYLKQVRMA
jgi:Kef-type K+ transport system membrane component KefB